MSDARASEATESRHDEHGEDVGTVEVQILLSWFFETADPAEYDYIRAAA